MFAAIGGLLALVLLLAVGGGVLAARRHASATTAGGAQAVVRVVVKSGSGTGFFVKGPDAAAYVATAYHVVSSGEPILVERTIEAPNALPFVEAYPEADLVAFDAEADLAVIRLRNVRGERFASFALAREPKKDEDVLSYGFPESSLAKRFGMVSKPGKILSVVKFPAYDHRTKSVLRNDAIDGLLVSTEIEPGFSGGPTCNARGEVVGVNVTKDMMHRAQNGAVAVGALRQLLAQVKPAKDERAPTADEVKALLVKLEREYLLQPVDKRMATPEDDLVSTSDMPRVAELVTEIRKLENDATTDPNTKLSGRAVLGVVLLRLPGQPLETYLAPSTQRALASCEARERGLREFFGALVPKSEVAPTEQAARAKCGSLATRPITWDMAALAVQWEGKERTVSVSKVEAVDADRRVYRASVKFGGASHLADVWVAADGGRVRLKLFDNEGKPVGLGASRVATGSAFQGTWRRSEPRTSHDFSRELGRSVDADTDTAETISVAVATNNTVTITHEIRRHVYFKGGTRLACGGSTLDLGIEQTFTGEIEGGTVMALQQKAARPLGADMARCGPLFKYAPDRLTVLKRVDDKLVMVRTDGVAFPETAEFNR
jgi:hypothetical protein